MMKKVLYFVVFCCVSLTWTGCNGLTQEVEPFPKSKMYGLWLETGTQHYVRFLTAEQDVAEGEYLFGKEWDEAEDVHESDLIYHGNGWFKWKIVQDRSELQEIVRMDYGWADIPKVYTMKSLSDTQMEYQDSYKKVHSFSKVVEPK